MIQINKILQIHLKSWSKKTRQLILLILIPAVCCGQKQNDACYFPPENGKWETTALSGSDWNESVLKNAIEYTKSQKSSGLLVLDNGKILVEDYWTSEKDMHTEDVKSIQKSVVSLLCGIAMSKGLLDIDDPVNKYLGQGWSNTSVEHENKILVKHLLSMSSGLDKDLYLEHQPGTHWKYNTSAYSKVIAVLEKITNKKINALTQEWLCSPTGMNNSKWVNRTHNNYNPYGFSTSLRDLGRLGLLTLNLGYWGDKNVISNVGYLKDALQSSQKMVVNYGYLFWLNTEKKFHTQCPESMIAMFGGGDKYVFVFPHENIVVVRLGERPEKDFRKKFLKLIIKSMPVEKEE